MSRFKIFLIVFAVLLFSLKVLYSQPISSLTSTVKKLNKETRVNISINAKTGKPKYISLYYTPQTKAIKLDTVNPSFSIIKKELENVFLNNSEFLDSDNPSAKYEKDNPIEPSDPKDGDVRTEIKQILVFYVENSNDNIVSKEIVSVFAIKKIKTWITTPDPFNPDARPEPKPNDSYMWFSIYGTNLKVALDNDPKLKNELLRAEENVLEKDIIPLRPNIILPETGISVVSNATDLDKFSKLFTLKPEYLTESIVAQGSKTAKTKWDCDCDKNLIKVTVPKPILDARAGEYSFTTFDFINNSNNGIQLTDLKISDNPSKVWEIKSSNYVNKILKPGDRMPIEVGYKQPKDNTADNTDVHIKFTDTTIARNFSLDITSIGANTKKNPPICFIDIAPLFLSGTVWIPSNRDAALTYNWNFSFRTGNNEIGYPYWTTGNWSFFAGYKDIIKFGITAPGGRILNGDFGTITPPDRRIDGVWGIASEFNFQTLTVENVNNPFTLGGYFYYGSIKDLSQAPNGYYAAKDPSKPNQIILPKDYYYIPMIAQVYYPTIFSDNFKNAKHVFLAKIGFSYHQIKSVHVINSNDVTLGYYDYNGKRYDVEKNNDHLGKVMNLETEKKVPSPFVKFDYIRYFTSDEGNQFGFGGQYVNNIVSVNAWIELSKIFRIEASYTKTIGNSELWENSSCFWISPRFYFPIIF